MKKLTHLDRRDFLKTGILLGGGLLIPFSVLGIPKARAQKSSFPNASLSNAFLRIGEDDSIHIILSKVEMGQGVWTTLPMLIAEELDCDWTKIKIEHSQAGNAYADPVWGQSTGGSMSTSSEFDRYRQVGAAARTMLVAAASAKLNVQPERCRTENGFIIAGDKRIRYGEVAGDAAKLQVPSVKLREPADWKYIGKSIQRLDNADKINGKAKYGLDIQFPEMLTAVVAHAPAFGGKIKSFDATEAKAVQGVRDVIQIPTGVAVIADHFWAASQGRNALKIEWEPGPGKDVDSKLQFEEYSRLSKGKGIICQQKGDCAIGLQKAVETLQAEFTFPYLAHAPMEPLNCIVKLGEEKCEIWTGNQSPLLYQSIVATRLGFRQDQVIINTPVVGGSFGRKGSFDAEWVVEAVNIAKASGKFIKLVWSREDDIRGGYYRPAYLHRAVIGIGTGGFPITWQHTMVGQSPFKDTPLEKLIIPNGVDYSTVSGVTGSPYLESVPDHSVELHTTSLGIPVSSWRSVSHTHTGFVMETLIDELATRARKDPLEYRRALLKNHPRHLAALNLAAEKSEWNKPLPPGKFRGIAVHDAMGSCVSQVVELSLENKKIRVHRVVCAIDCGLAVNPDGIRAQMEGGIIFGLTAALYGEITIEKGHVKQSNFNDYRMLRMNETPQIEVHIVASNATMGGAGEPGVPPIAPALANALFAATGKRIRSLPVKMEDLAKP